MTANCSCLPDLLSVCNIQGHEVTLSKAEQGSLSNEQAACVGPSGLWGHDTWEREQPL